MTKDEHGHTKCPACGHCVHAHGLTPDGAGQLACVACMRHPFDHQVCDLTTDVVQQILAIQYVETNRDMIRECGI